MKNILTKKAVIRLCATLVIAALIAGAIFLGIAANDFQSSREPIGYANAVIPELPDDGNLFGETVQSVRLRMSGTATVAADQSVSKQINATVHPESAKNKAVDWTIEWVEANSAVISEYVTVTPESDGSTVATVTCYQAFEGEALITATSREGRVFDTCRVVFVGIPSSLQAACGGLNEKNGAIGNYYEIGSGNTYEFDISPENVFGVVGADCAYTYSVSAVGSIRVQKQIYSTLNDMITWVDGTESAVNIADITVVSNYYPTIFDCSIAGNKLSITVNCTLENYYTSSVRNANVITYENRFRSYSNDNWYYEIKITERNSGIEKSIKLRPVVTVTNLNLDSDVITF